MMDRGLPSAQLSLEIAGDPSKDTLGVMSGDKTPRSLQSDGGGERWGSKECLKHPKETRGEAHHPGGIQQTLDTN